MNKRATTTQVADGAPITKYVDALAALVPAEVLALHATLLGFMTTKQKTSAGKAAEVIIDPHNLKFAFWALAVLSMVLYAGVRGRKLDGWDGLRIFIPPLAFAGWCMIQKTTAFDAVASWSTNSRYVVGLVGAPILALAAAGLAYRVKPKTVAAK